MATKATYYLNAPTLAQATAIFSNSGMTTLATDGFYSAGGITREVSSGILLPPTQNNIACSFISLWVTDSLGVSASNEIQLPLISTGVYDFVVDWGDGQEDRITSWNQAETLHSYNLIGTYVVSIRGVITGWQFGGGGDCLKIENIFQWGCFNSGNAIDCFKGCENISVDTVVDTIDLENVDTLRGFFADCDNLGGVTGIVANLGDWDVSGIENFSEMFKNCPIFNTNINDWDVTSAVVLSFMDAFQGFKAMFEGCSIYNSPLNNWDMSGAKTINRMFKNCSAFNQDISMWNVSNVQDYVGAFHGAIAFNIDITGWVVSAAKSFTDMFHAALSFNHNLGAWDIASLTTKVTPDFNSLDRMFKGSGMGTDNYTDTIVGWANYVSDFGLPLTISMLDQSGGMQFTNIRSGGVSFADAEDARAYITGTGAWVITGDDII